MNILVFNWRDMKHPQAGGAELNIFEQAKRWVKKGNKVTLFCGAYPNCKQKEKIDGIEIIRKGGRFTVYIHAFFDYLFYFRGKYDVVIDDINGFPFFTPLFVGKPKVAIVHHLVKDIFFKELRFPFSWMGYLSERFIMPLAYSGTKFITVSETSKKEMVNSGFNERNIEVVYNGLDKKYKPSKHKSSYPLIIYVGRIKEYKRLDILVRSMQKIVETTPEAKLIIVGDGEKKKDLEKLSKKLKLEKNILFMGFVSESEKIKLLQEACVFVTTSEKEGWGLSVLEANACGTPAVAFDVPGLNESIINGKTGLLVNTEGEMVYAIERVLKDSRLRETLSQNALTHSRQFSWDISAEKTLKFLEKVVNG